MATRPNVRDVRVHGHLFHFSAEQLSLAAIAGAILMLFVAAALMSALAPWR